VAFVLNVSRDARMSARNRNEPWTALCPLIATSGSPRLRRSRQRVTAPFPSSKSCRLLDAGSVDESTDHGERGGEAEPELDDDLAFVGAAAQLAG
jgi:hypothetical protein